MHKPDFECLANSDPTIKFFRDSKIDGKLFDWQVHVKIVVAKMVLSRYIDTLIKYNI